MPMNYIKEKGIKLYNAKGAYSIPMDESVLVSVRSIYKQLPLFYENQKKHI